jgi:5-methylcytosine-specific restriction protein A
MNRFVTVATDFLKGKPLRLRSPKWGAVRKDWLAIHKHCAACGSSEKLQVHHKKPFHLYPELELDYENLITLCEDPKGSECHLQIGHLGNWKSFNPNVETDAREILFARGKRQNFSAANLRTN